jgi:hypothetical protein
MVTIVIEHYIIKKYILTLFGILIENREFNGKKWEGRG